MKSVCCGAGVHIEFNEYSGKRWHCDKCGKPCEVVDVPKCSRCGCVIDHGKNVYHIKGLLGHYCEACARRLQKVVNILSTIEPE